jgi:phenylpropionate dioxygenase-like ring-hydroxylating dioxygenase large terminal subunit
MVYALSSFDISCIHSRENACIHIPVERDQQLCANLSLPAFTLRESQGFIWIWRGASSNATELPAIPCHPDLKGKHYGESLSVWNAHYTRCIENVCDYSHLPFVHRTTIGLFKRDYTTDIEMEDVPGGFRAHLLKNGNRKQYFEFLYPNLKRALVHLLG